MALTDLLQDAERQLNVCNACRYCEGYCAVFPALERKQNIGAGDVIYLANLCHDCGACLQACPYTSPHEFGIDLPLAMSEVRVATYERYAWPGFLARAFQENVAVSGMACLLGVVFTVLLVALSGNAGHLFSTETGPGAFYRIVPWLAMVIPSLLLSFYIGAVLWAGTVKFWKETGAPVRKLLNLRALGGATREAVTLHWQSGGGGGCYYPLIDQASNARRLFHVLVVSGFAAAFLSTVLAAIEQDVLGILPPYPLISAPVLVGSAGGIAMIVGATALIGLKLQSARARSASDMRSLDFVFLILLDSASITGMLTLILRNTPWLGTMLILHLGSLAGLYFTAPYGKFVHAVYRFAALVMNRLETDEDLRNAPYPA